MQITVFVGDVANRFTQNFVRPVDRRLKQRPFPRSLSGKCL